VSLHKARASSYGKSGEAPFHFHESPGLNDVISLLSNDCLSLRRSIAASTILIFSLRSVFINVESSSI